MNTTQFEVTVVGRARVVVVAIHTTDNASSPVWIRGIDMASVSRPAWCRSVFAGSRRRRTIVICRGIAVGAILFGVSAHADGRDTVVYGTSVVVVAVYLANCYLTFFADGYHACVLNCRSFAFGVVHGITFAVARETSIFGACLTVWMRTCPVDMFASSFVTSISGAHILVVAILWIMETSD